MVIVVTVVLVADEVMVVCTMVVVVDKDIEIEAFVLEVEVNTQNLNHMTRQNYLN
jgi:hypothetical protein